MEHTKQPSRTAGTLLGSRQLHHVELGKEDSMLVHFAHGKRIHRFDAERLADHCLPTTISDLQRRYSIVFSRKWVTVQNRFSKPTRVKLYFLQDENLLKAKEIVSWRLKREVI